MAGSAIVDFRAFHRCFLCGLVVESTDVNLVRGYRLIRKLGRGGLSMIAKALATAVFGIATLTLGGCQAPQTGLASQAVDNANADLPSLGYLEHRGRRHALRDLLDPAYRAKSDDPVARDFDVDAYFAGRSLLGAYAGLAE